MKPARITWRRNRKPATCSRRRFCPGAVPALVGLRLNPGAKVVKWLGMARPPTRPANTRNKPGPGTPGPHASGRGRIATNPYSTVTSVFTELAMKQISCAPWCSRSSSAFGGAAPAHSIFGLSFTLVTATRPGAISSVVPSA